MGIYKSQSSSVPGGSGKRCEDGLEWKELAFLCFIFPLNVQNKTKIVINDTIYKA